MACWRRCGIRRNQMVLVFIVIAGWTYLISEHYHLDHRLSGASRQLNQDAGLAMPTSHGFSAVPQSSWLVYKNESRINPHLAYIINTGISSRGDFFQFKQRIIPALPVNLTQVIDPPWEKLRNRHVTDVNCQAIIDHNPQILEQTKTHIRSEELFISNAQYLKASGNCSAFIRDRGYITSPVNDEEASFPLAYSLLMYRDLELTERLLRAIYRPQNYYCIHVERFSSHVVYEAAKSITSCFPNVFLTDHRYHVQRNYLSVLQPEFECMRMLLYYPSWRYFINLTGQEFPLRTNLELVRILSIYNGANDVQADYSRRFRYRTAHSWRHGRANGWKSAAPYNATVLKAQVHIAVVRGFVEYIVHDRRADDILWWLRDSNVPDEIFFAMLNHNPHLGVPGAFNGTRWQSSHKRCFTRFKQFDTRQRCYGNKVSHYICIIGVRMLGHAVRSAAMFANKFHLKYQAVALDCLEEWHHNRTLLEIAGKDTDLDYSIYAKEAFVTNHI